WQIGYFAKYMMKSLCDYLHHQSPTETSDVVFRFRKTLSNASQEIITHLKNELLHVRRKGVGSVGSICKEYCFVRILFFLLN
ncbi:hypothetical protein, partial [Escherichia coli]|uniref:hypothetical protein n=1 Tax=Escherichia coli TaxID=562 RepID=UPI003EDEE55E